MAQSPIELESLPHPPGDPDLPRRVSLAKWFGFYGLLVAAAVVPLAISYAHDPAPMQALGGAVATFFKALGPMFKLKFAAFAEAGRQFLDAAARMPVADKLLLMALYLSICTTFVPLSTGFVVAALATQQAGISDNPVVTVAAVSSVAALASTVANLNDYHLFLWLLRSHRISKIRGTRAGLAAARWFARAPFTIMVVFNVVHFPVDVPRMMAAVYGYNRVPFAVSNFLGRLMRYALYTSLTVWLGAQGWIVSLALLGLAVVLALGKVVPWLVRRLMARGGAAQAVASDGGGAEQPTRSKQ